jgi:hypothetical protein
MSVSIIPWLLVARGQEDYRYFTRNALRAPVGAESAQRFFQFLQAGFDDLELLTGALEHARL